MDSAFEDRRHQPVDNTIRAIRRKKKAPDIDLTIYTMEDGTTVSTMERVCRGELLRSTVTTNQQLFCLS